MGALQPVNVRMFRIMISSNAAAQQAEMFGEQSDGQAPPIIGPLPELPLPPSAPSPRAASPLECTTHGDIVYPEFEYM